MGAEAAANEGLALASPGYSGTDAGAWRPHMKLSARNVLRG